MIRRTDTKQIKEEGKRKTEDDKIVMLTSLRVVVHFLIGRFRGTGGTAEITRFARAVLEQLF